MTIFNKVVVSAVLGGLMFSGIAHAASDAEKCQAAKLRVAGKYAQCRLKTRAKVVKTGGEIDFGKCDDNYYRKWMKAEEKAGPGVCPAEGDSTAFQAFIALDDAKIADFLSGVRFVDNGDGTVSDTRTGLMWEKKDDLGGIHDKDNSYTWAPTGTLPSGTAFTEFLGTLNQGSFGGNINDPPTTTGCFANHCDWRLPLFEELKTILLAPFPCGPVPCIDPVFGPTQPHDYWTATSTGISPPNAFAFSVDFLNSLVGLKTKNGVNYVRAVRGGS